MLSEQHCAELSPALYTEAIMMGYQTHTGSLGLALLVVLVLCQQAATLELLQAAGPSPDYSPTPAQPGTAQVSKPPLL